MFLQQQNEPHPITISQLMDSQNFTTNQHFNDQNFDNGQQLSPINRHSNFAGHEECQMNIEEAIKQLEQICERLCSEQYNDNAQVTIGHFLENCSYTFRSKVDFQARHVSSCWRSVPFRFAEKGRKRGEKSNIRAKKPNRRKKDTSNITLDAVIYGIGTAESLLAKLSLVIHKQT
uniref:Uncharacterized protein n=1 Tax=Romanomermis culicivorax TaxID=13658 RepID=A0A915KJS2_ROMCU